MFIAFIICFIGYNIFLPLYNSEHIIIDYGINDFDICIEQPVIWKYCKYWFIFTYIFSSFFISNILFNIFSKIFSYIKKFYKPKNKYKKLEIKKEKTSHYFIDPKPPNKKLELLIRRK